MGEIVQYTVPVIGVIVVAAGIYLSNASRYFTIREHQEFANTVVLARADLRAELRREMDLLHKQLCNHEQRLEDLEGNLRTE